MNHSKQKPHSLVLATWNAQSLRYQKEELADFLEEHHVDIIAIQETQLKPGIRFTMPNYTVYRRDREDRRGGGLAILVKRNLKFTLLPSPNTTTVEALQGKIQMASQYIIIQSVYKSPHLPLPADDLDEMFNEPHIPIIAVGDYNAKHNTWNRGPQNAAGITLFNYSQTHNLLIHHTNSPTHYNNHAQYNPSTIDLAVTKNFTLPLNLSVQHQLNSDPLPVIINIGPPCAALPNPPTNFINWPHFRHFLDHSTGPIPRITNNETLEAAIQKLTSNAITIATLTRNVSNPTRLPPLPRDLKNKIRHKNQLLKRARSTQNPLIKQEVKEAIKEYHHQQWSATLTQLTKGDATIHKICKALKIAHTTTLPPIQGQQGLATVNEEKAEIFADAMEQQFQLHTPINLANPWEHHVYRSALQQRQAPADAQLRPTTPKEIKQIITKLGSKKAAGPDQIRNTAIKQFARKQICELVNIVNAALRLSIFPTNWKIAHIIVLPKPNRNHTLPQNYRPISLLSCLGKICEKVILDRLQDETEELGILPDAQFGFRAEHSTTQQTARLTDFITKALNQRKYTGILALDVEKAFDRVWHEGLLFKMAQLRFSTSIQKLVASFLHDRTFKIKIEDVLSTPRRIRAGVPQGSPLSPLLYNIYTADIPQNRNCELLIYADDTALAVSSRSLRAVTLKLQRHFVPLEQWMRQWKIKLNIEKTQLICISRKRQQPDAPLTLLNTPIPWRDTVKYLGLTYDKRLTWNSHLTSSRNKVIGIFTKLYPMLGRKSPLPIDLKLLIYKSHLRPILLYGAPSWGLAAHKHFHKLQTTQNRILRTCLNAQWYIRNTTIHRDTNLPTITELVNIQKDELHRQTSVHQNNTLRLNFNYDPHRPTGTYRLTKQLR